MNVITQTKNKVVSFLGITEERYHEQVWESGNAFALYYTEDDLYARLITSTEAYWAWFENQFSIIDESFLRIHTYRGSDPSMRAALAELWRESHEPEQMNAYPNSKLIRDSYDTMISTVITQSHANTHY